MVKVDGRFELLVYDPEHSEPHIFEVATFPLIIGRGSNCGVKVLHSSLSKQHARMILETGSVVVEDMDSKNGLVFSGDQCERAILGSSGEFWLGDVKFKLRNIQSGAAKDPFAKFNKKLKAEAQSLSAPPGSAKAPVAQETAPEPEEDDDHHETPELAPSGGGRKIGLKAKKKSTTPQNTPVIPGLELPQGSPEPEPEAHEVDDSVQWYYHLEDETIGPFDIQKLKEMADAGVLQPDTLIAPEGAQDWTAASTHTLLKTSGWGHSFTQAGPQDGPAIAPAVPQKKKSGALLYVILVACIAAIAFTGAQFLGINPFTKKKPASANTAESVKPTVEPAATESEAPEEVVKSSAAESGTVGATSESVGTKTTNAVVKEEDILASLKVDDTTLEEDVGSEFDFSGLTEETSEGTEEEAVVKDDEEESSLDELEDAFTDFTAAE